MEKVLVLNADFTPINVTSVARGFNLVSKGKAEIIKSDEKPLFNGITEYVRPLIIRLYNYVKYRVYRLKITRGRIYKRDGHQCVYCGSKKNLTLDHVIPRSRGGEDSWVNLVTACFPCNRVKGNRTPEEAGMKLSAKPYAPNIFSEIVNPGTQIIWEEFQVSM